MRYLVILAVLLVAGCGQKGALFLPVDQPEEPLEELSKEQPEKTVETKPST